MSLTHKNKATYILQGTMSNKNGKRDKQALCRTELLCNLPTKRGKNAIGCKQSLTFSLSGKKPLNPKNF